MKSTGVAILTAAFVAGVVALFWVGSRETPTPVGPASEELVADFVKRIQAGDRTALELLGPAPVFDDEPVTETVAEARQADYFLRAPKLAVVSFQVGEPGKAGRGGKSADRFTLQTKITGSTPGLRVRNARGEVEPPSKLSIVHPDLIVEVVEGKIHGVRADLHRD